MAEKLLSDVKKELGTLLKGKDGRLKSKELKEKLSFNFPTLHAKIQEAEAMSLTPMKRGSTEWTEMLTKFLELKEFVYDVEDRLDKLRIEDLISQELRNDLIARVSSMTLRRQGSHPQPEPDEQGNSHLMTRGYNKVRNFFLYCWRRNFRLNFTDLEDKLDKQFPWISVVTENSKSPAGALKVVGRDEDSESDDRRLESKYSSLPNHLKLCFKYFSLIPKGYWIDKEVLTQLWMAEGFTNPEEEETAEKCFDDLVSEASFFKDIEKDEDGNIVRCKIHEPMLDFICHLSEDEFSVITDELHIKSHSLHSSLRCIHKIPTIESDNPKKMRTLLCFGSPSNLKALSDLYSNLKLLRVLDLSLSIIEELPADSVAKLEHLRYLNLSYTQIKKLPACICNLYLLQTLKLSYSLLSELPRETWKLQKLRHLEIDGTPMNHLPPGIRRLSNIQKLSEFIVSDDGGCNLHELGNLEHLQGRLIISHLDRVLHQEYARRAKLNEKGGIKHLILDGEKHLNSRNLQHKRRFNSLLLEHMCNEAESKSDDDREIKRAERVFEGINPHSGLKRLEIWNYFGSKLPTWLDATHSGLISLKLAKWLKMDHMPDLGTLPSLKFLHIYDMAKVRSIESRDLKGFSKLERLTLEKMPGWEEWKLELAEGDLPCFLELTLSNCPKLKNLPSLPQTLRTLEIHDCKEIEWNDQFPPLPTLEYLVVKGKVGNMCSLPNAPKLVSLTIGLSPEMTSFPNGFDKLKSLLALNIHFCPRLQSLPKELEQLNNLKTLHIAGCRLEDWLDKNKEVLKKIPNVEMDKVLPSGYSYDGDDIHNGKGNDYDHGDSGYGKEHAYYDDDNSSEEDDDD